MAVFAISHNKPFRLMTNPEPRAIVGSFFSGLAVFVCLSEHHHRKVLSRQRSEGQPTTQPLLVLVLEQVQVPVLVLVLALGELLTIAIANRNYCSVQSLIALAIRAERRPWTA